MSDGRGRDPTELPWASSRSIARFSPLMSVAASTARTKLSIFRELFTYCEDKPRCSRVSVMGLLGIAGKRRGRSWKKNCQIDAGSYLSYKLNYLTDTKQRLKMNIGFHTNDNCRPCCL